jgi:hypothetical protein
LSRARLLLAASLASMVSACTLPVREMPPDHAAVGEFGNDGKSWKLRDAVAVSGREGLVLIFSRLHFDRKKWVLDARLTDEDLAQFLDNEDNYAPELDIKLDADGTYAAHRMVYGEYGAAWQVDPALEHGVSLRVNDGRRIAGTLRIDGPRVFADVDFDLPVLSLGPIARPGVPLPADGGAPGHYLLARSNAVYEGDLDRLLALLSPKEHTEAVGHYDYDPDFVIAYEPGDIERSGASLFMLKQRMDMPRIHRIVGGSVDGTTAWVDFEGSEGIMGDEPLTGTAVLAQDRRGNWWIEELVTHTIPGEEEEYP